MDPETPLTDREILLALSADDWKHLRGRDKRLSRPWSQTLNVHPKMISFDDRFAGFLAMKLPPYASAANYLLATLKRGLHADEAHSGDPEGFREALPERLRAVLELPPDRFPHPEWFVHTRADHAPGSDNPPPVAVEPSDRVASDAGFQSAAPQHVCVNGAVTMPPAESLADTVESLELLYPVVSTQVGSLVSDLAEGRRLSREPIDGLTRLHDLWAMVPSGAESLDEARHLVAEASMHLADRELLASLANMRFSEGNEQAVARILQVQEDAGAAKTPLDPSERDAFAALIRVLRAEWPDDSDVQVVSGRFGSQVQVAAIRLTPEPAEEAAPLEDVVRDEAPRSLADGPSDKVPGVAVEGHAATEGPADAPADSGPEEPQRAAVSNQEVGIEIMNEQAGGADSRLAKVLSDDPGAALEAEASGSHSEDPEAEQSSVPDAPVDEALADASNDAPEGGVDEQRAGPSRDGESGATPAGADLATPAGSEARRLGREPRVPGDDRPSESAAAAPDTQAYVSRFDAAAAVGDFGLAYWYAVAGSDEVRAQAAQLLMLVTSSEMVAGSPHPRADAIAARLANERHDASASLAETVAAALAPAALQLPPFSEATLALNAAAARLGDECPRFIRVASTLTYERGSGLHTVEAPNLLHARDEARSALVDFQQRAAGRTMRFHRATEVWRELIRQQGVLGALAERALGGAAGVRGEILAIVERGVDRLIDDIDRHLNPRQAKRAAIIAGARKELAGNIQRYLEAVRAYVSAEESVRAIDRNTAHNTDLIEELIAALDSCIGGEPGVGSFTLGVAGWLRERLSPSSEDERRAAEWEQLARPLAAAYELERDSNGDFDPASVTVALLDGVRVRTPEAAFAGYVARHDYVGLAVLLERLRAENPTVGAGFDERERRARNESRETLARALEHTRGALARALAVGLTDAEAQDYQNKLERLTRDQNPHYREALRLLAKTDEELAARQQDRLDVASRRLAELAGIDDAARSRIAALIDAHDLLSAEEFLAQLSNGATSLPEEDATDRTLEHFWTVAADAATALSGAAWFAERMRTGQVGEWQLPHPAASERIGNGLMAWEQMSQSVRPRAWERMLIDVLSAVGFQQVRMGPRFAAGRASTANVFEARYDGYALTPTYGSGARGQYAIYLCWERKTVDGLLQAVRAATETQSRPTLVLYFQTLKPAERRLLAEQCRRKGLANIVIDHAAMAYLGTREEARLDGLMHVCLPFTGSNPYTPFVLGDVPREMFYGRRDELRDVQDPNGPLFVYGGRQLGKSALLKTAMSEFGKIDEHHVSIYLDLKAEGIGEWHTADELWVKLVPYLQSRGVVTDKVSKRATADVVAGQIADWLKDDRRRHLLLLLDESDAFLDQDSQPRDGGRGQFKNVYTLKNLMNQSERRFKPVFAGLHQVQRFHKESNGPMAHVGTEIPIGPLPPAEAYKLVVRPLEAIGFQFTSPDVVWRLLSHTNYQASLIQLFCQELVNDLKQRRLGLGEPPSPIDGATVDRVYENRELRGQIAQRFEWTIQLDNRYRVIALVAAWLNLADSEAVVPVQALRAQCADFWPAGFEGLSPDEFRSLLDEMVGLGVLVRSRADHYGIRSPNVIRLLGSKDEIERKLMESSTLELPMVFDPTRYRRRLTDQSRSPLTEAQAARMLDNASELTLIVASAALGANQLAGALEEIASSGDGVQLLLTTPSELTNTLTSVLRNRKPRHVFLDARGIDRHDLNQALLRLSKATFTQKTFTASVMLDPSDRVRLDIPPDVDVRELTLEPWTDVELRAVEPEADVPLSADVREQLLDLTGGWPTVLESVLAHGRGADAASILTHAKAASQRVVDAGWSRLADEIGVLRGGVEETVLKTLVDWGEPIGRVELADLLPTWEPGRLTGALDALTWAGAIHATSAAASAPVIRVNSLVASTIKQSR